MSWNYRIVKFPGYCALHEVFYDAQGSPWGRSEKPVIFMSATPEELTRDLRFAMRDVVRRKVLDDPKGVWPGKNPLEGGKKDG